MRAPKYAKHKSAQVGFSALAIYCGISFFASAFGGWDAMRPDVFGHLATSFQVEHLAEFQLLSAISLGLGLYINGHWRWSPALRFIGASGVAAMCWFLAISAFSAENGLAFVIYSSGFGLMGLVVAWWNLVDLWAAYLWGGEYAGK